MDNFSEMPRTNAPKMIKIEFHVPSELKREADQLAELEGWSQAEMYRIFWERGFAAYSEGSNKRLINKKLRKEVEDQGDQDEQTSVKET